MGEHDKTGTSVEETTSKVRATKGNPDLSAEDSGGQGERAMTRPKQRHPKKG